MVDNRFGLMMCVMMIIMDPMMVDNKFGPKICADKDGKSFSENELIASVYFDTGPRISCRKS